MPIPVLDLVVLGVTLISAVLATVRGATREILAIVAWVVAGAAAWVFHPTVEHYVTKHISNPMAARGIVIAGIFLLVLLIVSIITVKISDMILDSRIGAVDRTLGFVFGVLRGLLLCVIAWVMLSWFLQGQQPEWIKNTRTRPMLDSGGEFIKGLIPDNVIDRLKTLKPPAGMEGLTGGSGDTPADTDAPQDSAAPQNNAAPQQNRNAPRPTSR